MAAVRYKFTRISASGSDVRAYFEKGSSGFLGLISGSNTISETEKGCKEIYEEACANPDDSRPTYASSGSKEDARGAFYAIRSYKQKHGIPFDVEDLGR